MYTDDQKIKTRISNIGEGSYVQTKRGFKTVESLSLNDSLLTEQNQFMPILNIEKEKASLTYFLTIPGLNSMYLSIDSYLYVRDVEIVVEGGNPVPLISWPYWISIQDFDENKHLVLSPPNPETRTKYPNLPIKDIPFSTYKDANGMIWLQVDSVAREEKEMTVYHITLDGNNGVSLNQIAVK